MTSHAIGFNRKSLTNQAIQAASSFRQRLGFDQHSPKCVYDACQETGVTVRFNDINMDGMYQKSERPVIHISTKRPIVRRVFTCGHELGHHEFGHGSSIDELTESAKTESWAEPNEFLADAFSAHFLMPAIGIRGAFNRRGIKPHSATPEQIYVIACDYSVGYKTLITHLHVGLGFISSDRSDLLQQHTPKKIRAQILGEVTNKPLVVAGPKRLNSCIDMEVGSLLLLPRDTIVDAEKLIPIRSIKNGSLFEATQPGITQIRSGKWGAFVRASRAGYTGLARYRHLEDN